MNSRIKCSSVFIVNFEYIWHVVLVFCWLWTCKWWMEYCLNLNLSMHFRVRSRSPVTFKAKLYVTTVNNNFQPLPISRHKGLHLRCCIGLKLSIVTWSTKIIKGIGVHLAHPITKCNLGKIWKSTLQDALKLYLQRFFALN